MKKGLLTGLVLVLASALSGVAAPGISINGAGATFPYPVYSRWTYKYHKLTGVKINYQSIGSGGGIAQIKAKTVDFGASDAPLKKEELDEAGLIQFPMIIGGVVPVVNIEGIEEGQLKLTPELMAEIFLGNIAKWSDPAIKSANPGLSLPGKPITVVHRADGSGTTWIFTDYLSKISKEWKEKVGVGKAVSWPAGVGGKGNEGVTNYVRRVDGSIGYVEFAYALQNELPWVKLRNKAGAFVAPTIETFQAAAANADWENAPGFYMVLTQQPGEKSWPITGASFILLHKEMKDARKAKTMLKYFDWCFSHGDDIAVKLHYVPIPDNVVELAHKQWRKKLSAEGKPVWP